MCGITGILTCDHKKPVIEYLLASISILMNRGYDSVGVGTVDLTDSKLNISKYATNPDSEHLTKIKSESRKHSNSMVGIAHTRWATHGGKTDLNSHPHSDNDNLFAVVHNGIIENYAELKNFLIREKYRFVSETDTEVIVNLINYYYRQTQDIESSIIKATSQCHGTFALGIINRQMNDKLYCIKRGSPLLLGFGNNSCMIASERSGFINLANKYFVLENNILCVIEKIDDKISVRTSQKYQTIEIKESKEETTFKPYPNWTLKEICEQSMAVKRTLNYGGRIVNDSEVKLGGLDDNRDKLLQMNHIVLLGCGTSYHSGLLASRLIKSICHFDTVSVHEAGSFTLEDVPKSGKTGFVYISQSGETRDLYRCLDMINNSQHRYINIGIINVVDSLIAREVDCGIYLNAGREFAVASTKAFTCQYIALVLLSLWFSQHREKNDTMRRNIILALNRLPYDMDEILSNPPTKIYQEIATYLKTQTSMFILGRGCLEPIAYEGSLKIKEIGYIHTQGDRKSVV